MISRVGSRPVADKRCDVETPHQYTEMPKLAFSAQERVDDSNWHEISACHSLVEKLRCLQQRLFDTGPRILEDSRGLDGSRGQFLVGDIMKRAIIVGWRLSIE